MTYDHGVDTAYMDRIRQRVQDLFCPHPADHALAAAVRRLPRTVWLGRVPEGWCVLTDDGTDEGKPHIAADPLAAINAALEGDR